MKERGDEGKNPLYWNYVYTFLFSVVVMKWKVYALKHQICFFVSFLFFTELKMILL